MDAIDTRSERQIAPRYARRCTFAGGAESGQFGAQLAVNAVSDPGIGISQISQTVPEHEASQSTSQPRAEESVSEASQQASAEAIANSLGNVSSSKHRSLRNPKSPRSPAALRRANSRSKPDGSGTQGIRRLGAEPIGKKPSMESTASLPLPVPQTDTSDNADRLRVRFASLGGSAEKTIPEAHENGNRGHLKRDQHHAHALPDKQINEAAKAADSASTIGIR